MRMHLPSALSPGQTVRAMVSFTMTTGAPRSSAAVNFRPSTIRMPRMSKNSGVAACRNGSWPADTGGSARPGTAIGGTLKPENGIAAIGVAARTPGTARTRSSAASKRSSPRQAAGARLDVDDDDVVHRHPEVLREQVVEAAAEHARAREKQHRQRRLEDEQPVCAGDLRPLWRRRRRDARQRARGRLDALAIPVAIAARSPAQAAATSVSAPAAVAGATSGSSTCLTAPSNQDGQQQRRARRGDRDDGRFDEGLKEEPPARRAERGPDGELPAPAGRAHQQQRGGVGEADHEDERRHARQPVGDAPIDARNVRAAKRRQHDPARSSPTPACVAAAAAVVPGASRATIDAIRRNGCWSHPGDWRIAAANGIQMSTFAAEWPLKRGGMTPETV